MSTEIRIEAKERISREEEIELEGFCEEGGLPRTEWIPGDVLCTFIARDEYGRLAATAKLEWHGDRLFIEDLVVRQDLRSRGYGKMIVDATIDEARNREAAAMWAMARAVPFFKKLGFVESDDDSLRAAILSYCRRCRDYGKECHPELLKLDLTQSAASQHTWPRR